jgi:LPS-assembly lipoprotein
MLLCHEAIARRQMTPVSYHSAGCRALATRVRSAAARHASSARALAAAAALAVLAAGCGFHLQGAGTLPSAMAKTYVRTRAPHTEFLKQLTDTLRVRGAQLVAAPENAQALLDISTDQTGQRILSVSARNIPREYEVFYTVKFSLEVDGQKLLDDEELTVTRSYTYDETQVLAKEAEQDILRDSLAEDLARRVVRRIETLAGAAPAAAAAPAAPGSAGPPAASPAASPAPAAAP